MVDFNATIDPAELDLINAVAKVIDPGAWDDLPMLKQTDWGTYVEDEVATVAARTCNQNNRDRARNIAIEVIAIVRGTDTDGGKA